MLRGLDLDRAPCATQREPAKELDYDANCVKERRVMKIGIIGSGHIGSTIGKN
jgi:phosphoglycerate dehydrogenase-like enzyme